MPTNIRIIHAQDFIRKDLAGRKAVLCPLERFDQAEFFALCTQDRGLQVQAFTSYEEAMEWLMASPDAA